MERLTTSRSTISGLFNPSTIRTNTLRHDRVPEAVYQTRGGVSSTQGWIWGVDQEEGVFTGLGTRGPVAVNSINQKRS